MGEDTVIDCWSAHCRHLVVKIERDSLEGRLETLLDASVPRPIKPPGQIDIGTGVGRGWRR